MLCWPVLLIIVVLCMAVCVVLYKYVRQHAYQPPTHTPQAWTHTCTYAHKVGISVYTVIL